VKFSWKKTGRGLGLLFDHARAGSIRGGTKGKIMEKNDHSLSSGKSN